MCKCMFVHVLVCSWVCMYVCKNMCKSPMCLCMCACVHMHHMYTCDMGTRVSRQLCIPVCLCMCARDLADVSVSKGMHCEHPWACTSWKRKWKSLSQSDSLQPCGLHSPWNFPGQNTGVGSFSLLQGIFPTQGSNLGLPHCRCILYQLSHEGGPRILEWVAYSFSSRPSQPRSWTRVSCIAGRYFTSWASKDSPRLVVDRIKKIKIK